MKTTKCQLFTALAVSCFAAFNGAIAQPDASQAAGAAVGPDAAAPPAVGSHSSATAGPAEEGLTLNLRGVSVEAVLKYLGECAGFTILREANTQVEGTVDMVSETPLDKPRIVSLLNKVLARSGLTALQDGRTLAILTIQDAERSRLTPVQVWNHDPASIPQDDQVATEIISLHSLNATQVVKDLAPMLPSDAQANANEGGNAIILTATQSDIRRFTQIIQALDNSGDSDLEVFGLHYADSKAIAQELKDVFTAQDAGA
ncbi:MAG: secretin N-terminal domain-containing protein, partial [Verrucomicrobiota bacterium]